MADAAPATPAIQPLGRSSIFVEAGTDFPYTDAQMIDESERIRLATEAQLNADNEEGTLPDAAAPTQEDITMGDSAPSNGATAQPSLAEAETQKKFDNLAEIMNKINLEQPAPSPSAVQNNTNSQPAFLPPSGTFDLGRAFPGVDRTLPIMPISSTPAPAASLQQGPPETRIFDLSHFNAPPPNAFDRMIQNQDSTAEQGQNDTPSFPSLFQFGSVNQAGANNGSMASNAAVGSGMLMASLRQAPPGYVAATQSDLDYGQPFDYNFPPDAINNNDNNNDFPSTSSEQTIDEQLYGPLVEFVLNSRPKAPMSRRAQRLAEARRNDAAEQSSMIQGTDLQQTIQQPTNGTAATTATAAPYQRVVTAGDYSYDNAENPDNLVDVEAEEQQKRVATGESSSCGGAGNALANLDSELIRQIAADGSAAATTTTTEQNPGVAEQNDESSGGDENIDPQIHAIDAQQRLQQSTEPEPLQQEQPSSAPGPQPGSPNPPISPTDSEPLSAVSETEEQDHSRVDQENDTAIDRLPQNRKRASSESASPEEDGRKKSRNKLSKSQGVSTSTQVTTSASTFPQDGAGDEGGDGAMEEDGANWGEGEGEGEWGQGEQGREPPHDRPRNPLPRRSKGQNKPPVIPFSASSASNPAPPLHRNPRPFRRRHPHAPATEAQAQEPFSDDEVEDTSPAPNSPTKRPRASSQRTNGPAFYAPNPSTQNTRRNDDVSSDEDEEMGVQFEDVLPPTSSPPPSTSIPTNSSRGNGTGRKRGNDEKDHGKKSADVSRGEEKVNRMPWYNPKAAVAKLSPQQMRGTVTDIDEVCVGPSTPTRPSHTDPRAEWVPPNPYATVMNGSPSSPSASLFPPSALRGGVPVMPSALRAPVSTVATQNTPMRTHVPSGASPFTTHNTRTTTHGSGNTNTNPIPIPDAESDYDDEIMDDDHDDQIFYNDTPSQSQDNNDLDASSPANDDVDDRYTSHHSDNYNDELDAEFDGEDLDGDTRTEEERMDEADQTHREQEEEMERFGRWERG
ncbi:MAG: hypothetical protein Q9168_006320, partial [Polycauliona sp. 1 TL-2023]